MNGNVIYIPIIIGKYHACDSGYGFKKNKTSIKSLSKNVFLIHKYLVNSIINTRLNKQ